MKDYRLSEILSYCYSNGDCKQCELEKICSHRLDYISICNIEPRDMIELPCINEIDKSKTGCYTLDGKFYEVIFRDKDGSIKVMQAESKDEAYKFLAMLKGN